MVKTAFRNGGFTLVEVAIAIVIVGFLVGGAIVSLTTQMEIRNRSETDKILERARDALLGFAAVEGRLPCPASGTGATPLEKSRESQAGGIGECTNNFDGYLPASTLGIGPVDSETGLLIDAWGRPIRYAVTTSNSKAFTTPGQMMTLGMPNLSPDLVLKDNAGNTLSDKVVAIILSTGKTDTGVGENANGNNTFTMDTEGGGFDDLVIPISPYTLYNRMIAAGAL